MAGGVIKTKSATGDVYFISDGGKELKKPAKGVEVRFQESFPGSSVEEAVAEATKYAIGALRTKMEYQTRGIDCHLVVRNVKLKYGVEWGFGGAR
jgi:hypothetical protein